MSKIQVVDMEINSIRPYPGNPRFNAETVKALEKSIAKYGFNQPIVVDAKRVIIKGHSRWEACKNLGFKVIPVIVSDKDAEINDADRLIDNMISDLSTWEPEALSVEMRDVQASLNEIIGETSVDRYTGNQNSKGVNAEAITKAQKEMEGKGAIEEDYISIKCKDCDEEVFLSRTAVKNL